MADTRPRAKRATNDELYDVIQEMQDRYGEVPKETENLRKLMALKTQMRKLKLRAMESGPGRLVVTVGADAALDPVPIVQRGRS